MTETSTTSTPPTTGQGPDQSADASRRARGDRSIRAPRPGRAPRAKPPAGAEPGPSQQLLARFLAPSKVPARVGNLLYFVGLFNIAAAILRPLRTRFGPWAAYLPGGVEGYVTATAILSGLFLILIARAVKRGKRRGWWAAVALLSLLLIGRIVSGSLHRAPAAAVLTIVALLLLLAYRQRFTALGDPRTRWRALLAFVGLATASVVIGTVLVHSRSHDVVGAPGLGWGDSLVAALSGLVGADLNDGALHPSRQLQVVSDILIVLGLAVVLVPLALFLRSPRQRGTIDDSDDARLRSLLAAHPDSLGYFNTRADKEVVWSQTGKSGIAYRVIGGVMLASGDPAGDPEAWPGAIRAFLDLADRHGWTPAVLGCSELAGTVWVRETGFQALELGDEAIVDVGSFTLEGREMRNVRQMVNRIRRQGYESELVRVRDLAPEHRALLVRKAAEWRVGATERGFSMATSRVADARRDPDAVLLTATRGGTLEGFLQFTPWGSDGLSLDLMRRNHDAEAGINELLIVDALTHAPELGIRRISLNFAMFRSTFERGGRLGAGPILKTWRRVLVLGNRWFQLESLYKFNAKFAPSWFPRFLIYPRVADFVQVALAAGRAESFLVTPALPWRRRTGGAP